MRIMLNGESRDLAAPLTVQALLQALEIDPRVVAVELNRVVVKRARYPDTLIEDGAEVEIVAFVGGGRDRPGARGHRPKFKSHLLIVSLGGLVTVMSAQQTRPAQSGSLPDSERRVDAHLSGLGAAGGG